MRPADLLQPTMRGQRPFRVAFTGPLHASARPHHILRAPHDGSSPLGPSHRHATASVIPSAAPAASAVAPTAPSKAPPTAAAPTAGSVKQGPGVTSKGSSAPTFQAAIALLQQYWAAQGCLVWLPHNTEVGAGTMNPATFLRVQGPEPWSVCYAEPSIRPDDSRYGDNPNRLQRHTQFQVILKPDPGNSQELYLGSLAALGIDTKSHDVRFVEDNWESPVLGAWGLGWEVWLDGMEVTQFTYFQQAGSQTLEHPAVEITYGLERILMALQGVNNFKDIRYGEGISYGELFLQNEQEMSCYNLDEADIQQQRQRFDLFGEEAKRLLAKRLPVPAYDHVLKLSHTFNILDARGAVGVTERANCFATMRALAREVTGLWLERRAELGHPMGVVPPLPALPPAPAASCAASTTPATFVLEIGSEELPPDDVMSAIDQLRVRVPALLDRLRLSHGTVSVEGTPRRLAVVVPAVAGRQEAQESRVRGPPAKAAFAADGSPTKALEGFCKKSGVALADVFREADAKGVEYVWATTRDGGRTAVEALTAELPALITSLSFKKSMRWRGDATYSRPLRWVVALHGDAVLPFEVAGLRAGNTTRVLRNAASPTVQVPSAEKYLALLESNGIQVGVQQRRDAIWAAVQAQAAALGGAVPESARGELLSEVSNLVESPTVICGSFAPEFLELPQEVLVMVMRKHQRYFPVFEASSSDTSTSASTSSNGPSKQQRLLPHFITVANGPVDVDVVAAGNAAVLRARFEDGAFFYREDLKQPLAAFRPKLSGTMFQRDLGSLLDKSERVERLIAPLASACGLQAAEKVAVAAAHVARADLATSTVMEMTALAGVMGRHYALKQGTDPAVAEAIYESVLPRNAGDALSSTPAGILVAVADRLDSLVGLVAAGCAPSAAADPYGLRRAAYGMLQTLVTNDVRLSLKEVVAAAAGLQPIAVCASAQQEVLTYIGGRLEQLIIDGGVALEAVRAVLAERGDDPALAWRTAQDLQGEWQAGGEGSSGGRLASVLAAFSRPTRIVRGKQVEASWTVDPALFDCNEERALHTAFVGVASAVDARSTSVGDFLAACVPLIAPIDAYFEKVFVMSEDEKVRRNRLAMLRDLAALPRGVIDLSQLPGF